MDLILLSTTPPKRARMHLEHVTYEARCELRKDMVAHFRDAPERDSTVHIRADPWPRFTMKEFLLEKGLLPGVITKRLDLLGFHSRLKAFEEGCEVWAEPKGDL